MVQRLQSVLTLYLSGVLAFLGLWWYIYRKKEYHLTDKDDANDETTADQEHLSSPRDVGNCVVENGHSTGMHLDGHAVRERSLVEQELVDITNTAAAEQGIVPLCQSQPEVRVVAADGLISSLVTAAVKPVYESTESSAQVFLETAAQGGPKQDLELQWEHQPCVPSAMRATSHESTCSLSICDLGSGKSKSVGESAGLNQPPQSETLEDITNSTLNLEPTGELVRLEPAGEVVRLEPAGGEVVRLEPAGGEVVRLEPAGGEVVRLEPAGGEVVRLEPAGGEVVRLEPAGGEVVRLEPAGGEVVRLEPAGGEVEKIRLELAVEVEKVRLEEEVVRLEPAEEEVRLEPAEEVEEVRLEPVEEVRLEPAEEVEVVRLEEEVVRLEPAEEEVRLEPVEVVRLEVEVVRLEPAEEEVRLEPAEEVEMVRREPAEEVEEVRLEPAEEEVVRLEPAEEVVVRLEPAEEVEKVRLEEEVVRLEEEVVRLEEEVVRLEPAEEVVRLEPAEEVVRLEPAEEVVRLEPAEEVVRLEPAEEVVRLEPAEEVVRLEPAEEVVRLEPAEEVVRLEPAEEVVRLEPAEEVVRLKPAEEVEVVRLKPAEEEVRLEPAEEEVRLEPAEEEVRLEPAEEEVRLEPAEEEVRLEPAEEEVRLEPAEEEVRLEPAEEEVRLEPAEEEVRLEPAEEEVRLEPAEEEVRLEPAEEEVRLEPAEEEVRLEPAEEEVRLEPAEEEVRLEPAEEEVRLEPAEEVEEVRLEPAEEVEMVRRDPAEEVEMVRREPAEEEEVVRLEPEGDILSAVEEPTFESSLQADTCLASPSHLITSRVSASKQPLGMLRLPQKKESEECKLSRSNTAEINQLVSGLITDVVSAAVNQFLKEKTQLGHSVSPLRSGDPCKAPDHISMDNSEPEHEMPPLFQEDPCSTTGRENISSSPIVQEDVKHDHSSRAEIETEKIEPAEDSAVGDFGSSARQTEKVSSGKELSTSMSPQPPRGPAEELGATSMFLTNGWWMANVTGSGVNSMDCVDGYCQHEARDIKHSSPSLPSQLLNTNQAIEKYNQSHNSSQSPTVWEIEVPKHFVGRLIGKKGRHVNYLKETSGAKVFITVLPYTQEFQICHIEGSEEQVDCALELIRKKFKDLDVTNCYVQPPVASLPSLSITSWLLLPHRVTVEVTVIQVASGNCVFLQQHKHPTFHAFCSLDQNMSLCYSHPGCPPLPAPVEVGVICAAQMPEGSWWRAQVMGHHEETMVELRYVDYGGYDIVKMDTLRQIRSDFVALPFQGSEVILENIAPIPDFSAAAKSALEEMTRGLALLAQVTNCHTSGIPLVQIWRTEGEELVSVNRAMVDNGLCTWVDSP
ncbi:titin isoform X1 [Oncorhynchus kisutch]|uniref:titin isoform X1 n=1 Tax=Oncorhynchus kisutch TaxID=8019 RepID=UPI0012DF1D3B|nr:titin isoform X1 [Oncorhynchus kisutch]